MFSARKWARFELSQPLLEVVSNGSIKNGVTAVAMSGGLDSSVTAWMLARRGEAVVGLSMLLWDRSSENRHGRCCGALDLGDAKRVAQQCGIRHYTLAMEESFQREVVDPFVADYLSGRTPIPCTRCNTWIKFDLFLEKARELGANKIATGHYARIVEGPEGFELHRSRHEEKDQSYYLFELTQKQLAASRFPLGDLRKDEVREMARSAGLVVANKGESMEICFVSGGIREFVEEQAAVRSEQLVQLGAPVDGLGRPAVVVNKEGEVLGQGEPYYRYTVGQRKGLGVSGADRLYVQQVQPEDNRIVVGSDLDLLSTGLLGEGLHWIGPPATECEATVRIRSRHSGVRARIVTDGDQRARVEFDEAQQGVTPGQAAVFYDGSQVLGGCWITASL